MCLILEKGRPLGSIGIQCGIKRWPSQFASIFSSDSVLAGQAGLQSEHASSTYRCGRVSRDGEAR